MRPAKRIAKIVRNEISETSTKWYPNQVFYKMDFDRITEKALKESENLIVRRIGKDGLEKIRKKAVAETKGIISENKENVESFARELEWSEPFLIGNVVASSASFLTGIVLLAAGETAAGASLFLFGISHFLITATGGLISESPESRFYYSWGRFWAALVAKFQPRSFKSIGGRIDAAIASLVKKEETVQAEARVKEAEERAARTVYTPTTHTSSSSSSYGSGNRILPNTCNPPPTHLPGSDDWQTRKYKEGLMGDMFTGRD